MRHTVLALLTTLVIASCTQAPQPKRYVVVRGDTLGEIATTHGVTVDQLRAWNDLQGDLIEVDQVLIIHAASASPGTPEPVGVAPRRKRRSAGTSEPAEADAEAPLVMPQAKPCLAGPEATTQGEGFETVSSQGLAPGDVKAAINRFVPRTASCMPDGWTGRATVQVDLLIGCNGLLTSAEVHSSGGLPDETLACITDRLRYAEFPAHDLPDGEQARVPLRYAYQAP